MFPHAIVGIDFSPGGEVLMRSLSTLRQFGTRRVTLVHALDVSYPVGGMVDFQDGYRAHLLKVEERVRSLGLEPTAELVIGGPSTEIPRVAAEVDASIIVVGSRSHSRLVDAFIGNVAWGVLRHATVPVLVVRIGPGDGEGDRPFEAVSPGGYDRVLYPTDWSEPADRAFQHLENLAGHGEITSFLLLHSRSEIDEARTGRSTETEDLERLEALAERLRAAGATSVDVEAPSGAPAREIIRRADERPGTLIVMGTHGRGVVGDAFLGGVSREVLRTSRSSILLVPPTQ